MSATPTAYFDRLRDHHNAVVLLPLQGDVDDYGDPV